MALDPHPVWLLSLGKGEHKTPAYQRVAAHAKAEAAEKGGQFIGDAFAKLKEQEPYSWMDVTALEMETTALRQDKVPLGVVAKRTMGELVQITHSAGLSFDAPKQYESKVWMFELLTAAHLINPAFEEWALANLAESPTCRSDR